MVWIRTESIPFAISGSFGEIINGFQDFKIKRNIKTFKRKNKKLENDKDSVLFKSTCLNTYIYIYIYIYIYNVDLYTHLSVCICIYI